MVADDKKAAARKLETEGSGEEAPDAPARKLSPVSDPSIAGRPGQLDGLIHERVRLGIVSALAVNDRLAFTELRKILDTTDGNLSAHARKLEDSGYIACQKSFLGRVPRTDYALTDLGRARLTDYLAHMEALIRMTRLG
jgi:DNA-binding HxlR family transcriptional regulator